VRPDVLALLRDMDQRDCAQLGVILDASPARTAAVKAGVIVKRRPARSGKRWIYGITPAGQEALK
jgi:hypothetical protein